MSDATEPSGAKVRLWDRLWVQIAGAIFLVLAVFALAFYGFAVIDTARRWPWSAKTHPGLYELSRTAVPVAALVGGAAAIVVGIRRQRSTEKTVELTARTAQITADAYALDQKRAGREEIDRLRDRYTAIAAQLGDDAAPVRLAGVYAMAALADDWITMGNHREAQVCIDVPRRRGRSPPGPGRTLHRRPSRHPQPRNRMGHPRRPRGQPVLRPALRRREVSSRAVAQTTVYAPVVGMSASEREFVPLMTGRVAQRVIETVSILALLVGV